MKQQIFFYILLIISVISIFCIWLYKKNDTILEGKGKKGGGIGKAFKKVGKFVKSVAKTISKATGLNKIGRKQRRRRRRNRARNKRIKKYIFALNAMYDYSVSALSVDYLQKLLDDLKNFYIDNYTVVDEIWLNLKPETRTYLKQKYVRFYQLKQKVFIDNTDKNINVRKKKNVFLINNSMLSVSSNETFDLPPPPKISNAASSMATVAAAASAIANSDFALSVHNFGKTSINQIRNADLINENFVDFFGNVDNGNNIVMHYVNLYNNYASSALYTNDDKIEKIFKSYETFFDTQIYEIKKTIDGIKQDKLIQNGQTLNYINTKLEYFYKILNTINQKTTYGQNLSS